jgi:6-phosphofructokinase 1
MRRLALLTSGGDAPGMNPAIRAVVTAATGGGAEVVGFRGGFRGLFHGETVPLDRAIVESITDRGGTILRSSRFADMRRDEVAVRCVERLKEAGADALVVIGGDGSVQGSRALERLGASVVHIPSTIDNDLFGTDITLGVDTCLNTILTLMDSIRDTASSMDRPIVVEVMGRLSGYLALSAAIGCGAHAAVIPERPFPWRTLQSALRSGRVFPVVLCAEGAMPARAVADHIRDVYGGADARVTVLGYIQRGGTPSFFDRIMGARFGEAAADAAANGDFGRMVAYRNGKCVLVPLEEVAGRRRQIQPEVFELAKRMDILFE